MPGCHGYMVRVPRVHRHGYTSPGYMSPGTPLSPYRYAPPLYTDRARHGVATLNVPGVKVVLSGSVTDVYESQSLNIESQSLNIESQSLN